MLWEHERSASVRDGEARGRERTIGAALHLVLQRALVHVVDQVEWSRAKLNVDAALLLVMAMMRAVFPPFVPRRRKGSCQTKDQVGSEKGARDHFAGPEMERMEVLSKG